MSQAKLEKEMRFIRIVIMIVTNVTLNTRKNVDNVYSINTTGTIQLIRFPTKHYMSRAGCRYLLFKVQIFKFYIIIS